MDASLSEVRMPVLSPQARTSVGIGARESDTLLSKNIRFKRKKLQKPRLKTTKSRHHQAKFSVQENVDLLRVWSDKDNYTLHSNGKKRRNWVKIARHLYEMGHVNKTSKQWGKRLSHMKEIYKAFKKTGEKPNKCYINELLATFERDVSNNSNRTPSRPLYSPVTYSADSSHDNDQLRSAHHVDTYLRLNSLQPQSSMREANSIEGGYATPDSSRTSAIDECQMGADIHEPCSGQALDCSVTSGNTVRSASCTPLYYLTDETVQDVGRYETHPNHFAREPMQTPAGYLSSPDVNDSSICTPDGNRNNSCNSSCYGESTPVESNEGRRFVSEMSVAPEAGCLIGDLLIDISSRADAYQRLVQECQSEFFQHLRESTARALDLCEHSET